MADTASQDGDDECSVDLLPGEFDDDTLNRVFGLLEDQRQRYVLAALDATPGRAMSTDELADHLLDSDPSAVDRDNVLVSLHHSKLPHLAATGVIDFDARTGTVRYHGADTVTEFISYFSD